MAARVAPSLRIAQLSLLGAALLLGVLAGLDPRLALVAVLGLGFAVLTLVNLTAGVCLFALASCLDTVNPVDTGALSFPKLMGALLVASWLAQIATSERDEDIFSHPAFLFVVTLFVGWTAISVAWAEEVGPVIENLYRLIPNAMLFLVVYSAVRRRDQALWVIGAFVIAALLSAVYGLAVPTDPSAEDRLSGAAGNANETAAVLVAGAALAAGLGASMDRASLRLAGTIGAIFCVFGVMLTLSRGGIIALGAAMIAAVFVAGRWRVKAIAVAVTVSLAAIFYFGAVAGPDARERVLELGGGSGRSDIWAVGWRMVEDQPLRGIGAGNFPNTSVHYLLEPGAILRGDFIVDEPKVAHNTYLEVLAEQGVIGLALFLGILGFALWCAVQAARTFMRAGDEQMEIICRALFVALVGLLASDFFGSRAFSKQLWLLMALTPALLAIARAQLAQRSHSPTQAA